MVRDNLRATAFGLALCGLLAGSAVAQVDMQQKLAAEAANPPHRMADTGGPGSSAAGVIRVPPHFAQLKLAPGFLLSLKVLDDDDFTGAFRVDAAGDLTVPELGALHVAGQTASEARELIARRLVDEGLMRDPQVELNVVEYTPPQITITGEVAEPGVYPLLAPEKLDQVLALAGGTTIMAGNQIVVTRPESNPEVIRYAKQSGLNSKALEDTIVQPGDSVQIKRAGIAYVLGAVTRPGGYLMQEDGSLSVLQAISVAGGTSLVASTKSVYVMRKNEDGSVVIEELPYAKMERGKAGDVALRSMDVLYVPTSKFKATITSAQGIFASLGAASIYAGVLY